MTTPLSCFKAYDVRGRLGEELNEDIARRIGFAYGRVISPRTVAVGGDVRPSSESLKAALIEGLRYANVDVLDLGLTGTEEIYHAVFSQKLDGGIEVTGSHNPLSDNGLKFVREDSRPISGDTGLNDIKALAETTTFDGLQIGGSVTKTSFKAEYVEHLLSYCTPAEFPPLTIVANPGNGAAGPVLDMLEARLADLGAPVRFIKIYNEPDGTFPNGIPNPLLPENRAATADAVKKHGADLGLAWDGDFDRCFFFDEHGGFIEGYYIVGLLAESFLATRPGAAIIHDPRLTWNTVDIVTRCGGKPIEAKTGHAFIKERMRLENAIYGGEMSAHHYFSDFAFCDSGMIPWLLVLALMGRKKLPLSALVAERQALFPCSGEINYRVNDIPGILKKLEERYTPEAVRVSKIDGLSIEMANWRFNVRGSNTEPLLRLNVESRGDAALVESMVKSIEQMIAAPAPSPAP